MTDALQILLTWPAARFAGCLILALCLFQAIRLVGAAFSTLRALWAISARYIIPVWRFRFWIKTLFVASLLFLFSPQINDYLEFVECRYIDPVHIGQADTPEHLTEAYEAQIKKYCDTYEFAIVQRRTAEMAAKINSTPQVIYEAALLECGLNPFRVRADGVAAGWIQFTRAGLSGLGVSLEQVIAACQRRDIGLIMDLTERYLTRKWEQAGRPDMRNTIDLYLAIFAPVHIGAQPERVVYAGFSNPAYALNSGLDGWYQDGGLIIRKPSMCDGKITVWEIYLCLERKKAMLIK